MDRKRMSRRRERKDGRNIGGREDGNRTDDWTRMKGKRGREIDWEGEEGKERRVR